MRTITSCEYAAICRKQYGRDRDPVGNGCLLGKVLVKGSAFLSLHYIGMGKGVVSSFKGKSLTFGILSK